MSDDLSAVGRNSRARLGTETANRLAGELLAQGSLDWLRTALGGGNP